MQRLLRRLALAASLVLGGTVAAQPAQPDLGRAEELLRGSRYQDAYDLLAPYDAARRTDPRFTYLLGRAALETKRGEQALALLQEAVRADPDDIPARLALGRAYFALGRLAEAKIEFETVLSFDNLPRDLESQVQIYNEAARAYLEEGRRFLPFGYAETGLGGYRVNSTRGTNTYGGDRHDLFYTARVGGGASYLLSDNYTLDGSLDYRFRWYDNTDTRNDSDLRWRAAVSRALGEDNITVGSRGRVSYRGQSSYRNDYSVFTTYRYRLDEDNQLTVGAEVRRRRYPTGPLRERSRTTADASVGWIRSLADGGASLALRGWAGRNYATSREDGDSDVFGAEAWLDFTLTEKVGGFLFLWWERDSFNADDVHFHPDELEGEPLRREDNLYEVGGGLVWEFAPTWTLRPEFLWLRDQSNVVGANYSSTEYWLTVRKAF